MPMLRFRLTLRSPLGTPLVSGTLFGNLCWARHYLEGEPALVEWLAELPESPFLISDGLPADRLPVPILAPTGSRDHLATTAEADQAKRLKRVAWLPLDRFRQLQAEATSSHLHNLLKATLAGARAEAQPPLPSQHRAAHNTINRLTATTPDTGGLYFVDEWWANPSHPATSQFDVYVETVVPAQQVLRWFEWVGEHGYGRDASVGRGRFSVELAPVPAGLFDAPGAHRVSFSRGTLSGNMQHALYRLEPHAGKLGGLRAIGAQPFKRPLLLTKAGATFRAAGAGPFGALIRGHAALEDVVHNAWHLTAPINIPAGALA